MINLNRMACAHGVNMVQTGFIQVPRQLHRRLHVHVVPPQAREPGLPPNEAWLLVFRALVLTADFILHSVVCVDMPVVPPGPEAAHSDIVQVQVVSPVRPGR